MKPACSILHTLTLAACLAAQLAGTIEMPGMRRSIQTITETGAPRATLQALSPAAAADSD